MNAAANDLVRHVLLFSGRVQGVGFRLTAVSMARSYSVGGTVRNMVDGRVELILEGPSAQIDEFVAALQDRFADFIADVARRTEPVEGIPPAVRIVW